MRERAPLGLFAGNFSWRRRRRGWLAFTLGQVRKPHNQVLSSWGLLFCRARGEAPQAATRDGAPKSASKGNNQVAKRVLGRRHGDDVVVSGGGALPRRASESETLQLLL